MNIKDLLNGYKLRRYQTLEKKIKNMTREKEALKTDILKAFELSGADALNVASYELSLQQINVKEKVVKAYSYQKLNIKKAL